MNSKETRSSWPSPASTRSRPPGQLQHPLLPLSLEAASGPRRRARQVHHVCGSYVQDWLLLDTDYNWRVLAAEGGELRAVADIGTHWLDLVHAITGLESRRSAPTSSPSTPSAARRARWRRSAASSGRSPTSSRSRSRPRTTGRSCCASRGRAGQPRRVAGDRGRKNSLRYELAGRRAPSREQREPGRALDRRRGGPNELLMRDPSILSGPARAAVGVPGGHAEGYADTFKQHFRAFYGYVAKGDFSAPPPFATFLDGHREVVLCERSSRATARVLVKVPRSSDEARVRLRDPSDSSSRRYWPSPTRGLRVRGAHVLAQGQGRAPLRGVTHWTSRRSTSPAPTGCAASSTSTASRRAVSGTTEPARPDPAEAQVYVDHLKAVIRAPAPGRGSGEHVRGPRLDEDGGRAVAALPRNLAPARGLREQHEVRIGIENCPCSSPGTSGRAARTRHEPGHLAPHVRRHTERELRPQLRPLALRLAAHGLPEAPARVPRPDLPRPRQGRAPRPRAARRRRHPGDAARVPPPKLPGLGEVDWDGSSRCCRTPATTARSASRWKTGPTRARSTCASRPCANRSGFCETSPERRAGGGPAEGNPVWSTSTTATGSSRSSSSTTARGRRQDDQPQGPLRAGRRQPRGQFVSVNSAQDRTILCDLLPLRTAGSAVTT